jgi:hypothetical protein
LCSPPPIPPPLLPLPINYDHSLRPNQEKLWKMQQ